MKILHPTKKAKMPRQGRNFGRFKDVWAAVQKLKDGAMLPVQCESKDEVRCLYMAAKTHRTLKLNAATRELTVYISKAQ